MTNRLLATAHGTNREAFEASDWGLFLGLSCIWGASFLFIDIGLDHFHPGLVTLLRVGFGASFMAVLPKARRTHIPVQDLKKVAALGVIWIAVPLTLFPIAQQWIDSAVAGMLNGAVPIFTALIASILLSQLPGRLQMIGLAVGFLGIVSIALPSAESGTTAAVGVALVLAATVCYGFATNIVAPIQQKYGSLAVMARAQWFAVVLVLPYGIYGLTKSDFGWNSLLALLAVGLLGTGLAFVMMGSLIGRVGPTRASFITYLIPVVALVLGVALLGETVSPIAVIGSVLVIIGALLASRREDVTTTQVALSTNMTGDEPV
jgi:drug/metabolite transporter (DMT)-like permease